MPYSLKQLDQRYQNICNNIKDAKEYTIQHLKTTIEMNLQHFFNTLDDRNLEECDTELEMIEETIRQCRSAVRNEQSRRLLTLRLLPDPDINLLRIISVLSSCCLMGLLTSLIPPYPDDHLHGKPLILMPSLLLA
ncbi:uncharacterized protein [Montipora foliosa]|uniref:uncharacterized protein n=1 Tax=Montipora foliosa TaxID=591990 RepID=UPI0035F18C14